MNVGTGLTSEQKMLLFPKRTHNFSFLEFLIPSYLPKEISPERRLHNQSCFYVKHKSKLYATQTINLQNLFNFQLLSSVGSLHGRFRNTAFTLEGAVSLNQGTNNISLLSATVGLPVRTFISSVGFPGLQLIIHNPLVNTLSISP